jgi:hypothetical protein
MFCETCETVLTGDLDDYGAKFLRRVRAAPDLPHCYDELLLRWAVSLSLRVLFAETSHLTGARLATADEAIKQWKAYLRGEKPSVGCFRHYLFIRSFDKKFQKLLDWDFLPDEGLTFIKIGPIVAFGLTKRPKWSKGDEVAASRSMLKRDGGYVQRFGDYAAGTSTQSGGRFTRGCD